MRTACCRARPEAALTVRPWDADLPGAFAATVFQSCRCTVFQATRVGNREFSYLRETAIDEKFGSIDKAAVVGGQKHDSLRHHLRFGALHPRQQDRSPDGAAAAHQWRADPPPQALADGVHSADVVLNILSRRRDPGRRRRS